MNRFSRNLAGSVAIGALLLLSLGVASAQAASPAWRALAVTGPTHLAPGSSGEIAVAVTNVGGASSDGTPITAEFTLPAGIVPSSGGLCTATGQSVFCSKTIVVPPRSGLEAFALPVTVDTIPEQSSTVDVTVKGGGAADFHRQLQIVVSSTPATAGIDDIWAGAFDADGLPDERAGGHPHSAGLGFRLNTIESPLGFVVPAGTVKDLDIGLPPGFVGNPTVTQRCPTYNLLCEGSGAEVGLVLPQIGSFKGNQVSFSSDHFDVRSFEPPQGHAAGFAFQILTAKAQVFAHLRSDEDYSVELLAPNIQTSFQVFGTTTVLDGIPAGSGGKAFLTNPTDCGYLNPVTTMVGNTWQVPALFEKVSTPVPAVTGCDQLVFDPSFGFDPGTTSGASPAGATAELSVPQDGLTDPGELATPHLKRSVVALPEGLVLNPSAADGLEACSTQQIGLKGTSFAEPNPIRFDKSHPSCPDASKVGTVEIDTPLLDDELAGTVYLAAQGDNPFGSLIALYLVVDDPKTGVVVKLPGKVDVDSQTGRLTATFDHNPQVPFSDLRLRFRSGSRATLATPDVCGDYDTAGEWTPWSAPDSGPPATTEDSFSVSAGCAPSKAQRPLGVGQDAGSVSQAAGSFAPFKLRLTRSDGSQELDRIDAAAPQGLLASLKDVPYCSEGAIAQAIGRTARGTGALERAMPSCPAASRIGATSVGAGVGSTPFYAGGDVYLAGAYKGAPLSMVFVVPAVAGPFDLGVQVVRAALHVDRSTARVTAVSDTIPKILEGVPLQIQDIRVSLDRPGFTLNPTSCDPKQIDTTIYGASGATRALATPFQVSGCANLPFKPKLALALTGRNQVTTGKHPGIKAQVNQTGVGEAGIEKAIVRLPKSLALDPDNAQALCEFADGTKPDLENHCPKGSIVGRARAISPLLKQPLAGNVYFVKNIRIDPKTGNQIRTLPMIIVALRGEVAINLKGESSTTNGGKLVNTFASVPDAPISQFNLNIQGGKTGIIAVTRTRKAKINLCAGRHIAETDMDAQNGRRHDFDVRMKTPCTKKQTKAAKLRAKRAAAARAARH